MMVEDEKAHNITIKIVSRDVESIHWKLRSELFSTLFISFVWFDSLGHRIWSNRMECVSFVYHKEAFRQ